MRNRILAALLTAAMLGTVAHAQLGSPPYTFQAGATINPDEHNTMFSAIYANALNRTGGTMTGTLTTQVILPDGDNTRNLGSAGASFASAWFDGTVTSATLSNTGNATIGGTLGVTGAATLSSTLGVTGAATFTAAAAFNNTGAASIDVAGGAQFGSGNVSLIDTTGKIPAISSTYFASLSGVNLTGVALLATANAFTARNDFYTYTETRAAPTISGGTLTLDLATASHFDVALNSNIATLTISNPPTSGKAGSYTLVFTADGTPRTVSWPASIKWPGGVAPTLTSTNAKKDVFMFITYDGGTSWLGFVGGQNF
ncbi:MAG TPA: hypothetical protein VEA16_01775 [Vicinamibacterales bacterium]|nr:hypothetical protein [Vicinamibacterales bacterium]